jgi:hypothetical protein
MAPCKQENSYLHFPFFAFFYRYVVLEIVKLCIDLFSGTGGLSIAE